MNRNSRESKSQNRKVARVTIGGGSKSETGRTEGPAAVQQIFIN